MAYRVVKGGLPYPCEKLFDLIIDVESYPRFVPMWEAVRVRDRTDGSYRTDQIVRLPWGRRTFSTLTSFERPHRIDVVSQAGGLGTFSFAWRLTAADDGTTSVDLTVEIGGSFLPVRKAAETLSREIVQGLLTAFEEEATRMYQTTVLPPPPSEP